MADDIGEPSILSSDPNERKLARRIRIRKHIEARNKQIKAKDEEINEVTPVAKQIFDATEALEKLIEEGDEIVAGVKVANDARESQRRKKMEEKREKLLEVLEEEDRNCKEKYQEIVKKWPDILASRDLLDIHDEMRSQNAKCLEILDKKDALIAQLKQELQYADAMYAEDIKNQKEDIDLLIERMENQIHTMSRAYRKEMELIENVIDSERKILLEASQEKWQILYKKLQEDTFEGREKRKEVMLEYDKEINKAIITHQEKFREQRISLELEIQNLQQEMENTKAICMMNVEKLDYNYAVLKHREEENLIVKNQQKRKINKLQDVITGLKKTYAELEESTRAEIQKLTNQILKAHKGIIELEEKSNYLMAVDEKKYTQIWDMNIKTANELVDKILTADRIIHEQLLLIEWKPPEVKLLRKEDLPSYCRAMCVLKQERDSAKRRRMISKIYKPATSLKDINMERRLLNHILKLIADHCDYLIEDTLKQLLSDYTEEDKLLIRLDKVFEALKITSEEELQFLLSFFLPYAHCPVCSEEAVSIPSVCGQPGQETESSTFTSTLADVCGSMKFDEEEVKLVEAVQQALQDENACIGQNKLEAVKDESVLQPPPSEETVEDAPVTTCAAEGIIEVTDENGEPKRLLVCDKNHTLVIDTEFVSNALKDFVERYEFVRNEVSLGKSRKETKGRMTVLQNITEKDVTEFWQRYRDIFSADRERLWDSLLYGLKKYYEVLKTRHELNAETESLRKQNADMRRLLNVHASEADSTDWGSKDAKCVPMPWDLKG